MKTILICGRKKNDEVKAIAKELKAAGAKVVYFNAKTAKHFTWTHCLIQHRYRVTYKGKPFEPDAIYWRTVYYDWFDSWVNVTNNEMGGFEIFCEAFPNALWVNSPEAFKQHQLKIPQLKQVMYFYPDLPVPDTILTNSPEEAVEHLESYLRVAVKPICGGTHTRVFRDPDLLSEYIKQAQQPQCVQEYIPGYNIRVYVVGNKTYASMILSDDDEDFRNDPDHIPAPTHTSDEFRELNVSIARTLGLQYTAIDWRRTGDTAFFLEANFAPCFTGWQYHTGKPVTKDIANLILENNA